MDNKAIEAIRERHAAATSGTWILSDLRDGRDGEIQLSVGGVGNIANVPAAGPNPRADAELLGHAHQDIELLLDAVDRLQAAVNLVGRLNLPMIDSLRSAAADHSPNWDVTTTVFPPSARGLVELIDALLALYPQRRGLPDRALQAPSQDAT